MLSPADRVELLVGGKTHGDWERYSVESDLLTPADAWHVSLGLQDQCLPDDVVEGAEVEVRVDGERAMVGHIDEIEEQLGKHEHTISLSGRDGAAVLVDCSAPIFVVRDLSLAEVVVKVVRPLGITQIKINADNTLIRKKINVNPGDTAWEVLRNAAEASGLWPWFTPDGTLVIGGPDYSTPPVATLIMRRDGEGNNVERMSVRRSMHDRFSEVTVFGQTHGTGFEEGKHALKGGYRDDRVKWYRPKIVTDSEADSTQICIDRARKLISDSRVKAFTLTAVVKGHRIVAPGQPADGKLWSPGQRVYVKSEPHNLDGIYFLMGRKFIGGRTGGAMTELTLKDDGVWILDAHPHKGKRRGKSGGMIPYYTGPSS